MNIFYNCCLWALVMLPLLLTAQTTDIVILNQKETQRLRRLIRQDERVKAHHEIFVERAEQHLRDQPRPLGVIYYEGLLDNDPRRVDTQKSLDDVDKVVDLIYTHYGRSRKAYARKAKQFVLAWAITYQPTGNTINENKFTPLFWAYYLFRDQFSGSERERVEQWMRAIAQAQMARPTTPNNNWMAKRHKIIATAGCILNDEELIDFAINGFKEYINTAYYADGTSNDLKKRDALHYHLSGLKPAIGTFINCTPFHPGFDLFDYLAPSGASIRQSVAYAIPYVSGEKERREWTNSQVELDKRRAAAGLAKYQPGMLFDPEKGIPAFEWAGYFERGWYALLGDGSAEDNYAARWIGLLNSPLVRQ